MLRVRHMLFVSRWLPSEVEWGKSMAAGTCVPLVQVLR
jgi:hypothetical protein